MSLKNFSFSGEGSGSKKALTWVKGLQRAAEGKRFRGVSWRREKKKKKKKELKRGANSPKGREKTAPLGFKPQNLSLKDSTIEEKVKQKSPYRSQLTPHQGGEDSQYVERSRKL